MGNGLECASYLHECVWDISVIDLILSTSFQLALHLYEDFGDVDRMHDHRGSDRSRRPDNDIGHVSLACRWHAQQ